ncbi:MAG: ATP-dependent DNA ligase [Alphaproteobacteria bacterium]|nr:ATP-dependent DNA ligase [Alphaproteobacteria bacterium]
MLLVEVVQTWAEVRSTRMRRVKSRTLARCLQGAGPDLPVVAAWLAGVLCQGRIGVGFSTLADVKRTVDPAPETPSLGVSEVNELFSTIQSIAGEGAKGARLEAVRGLFSRATYAERIFLLELISGELRQGAQEGVLLDAVATAADIPVDAVRRAFMLTGDLPLVAVTALRDGEQALSQFHIELFRPLKPMLASPAETPAEALVLLDHDAFVDRKLDGVRVQIHRDGDAVRVYTRHLHDVTGMVPEVAQAARSFPWEQFVLDGEAIAMRDDGSPHPFQVTMKRFGRKVDVGRLRLELPLSTYIFDALLLDGEECIDWPAHQRFAALDALPAKHQVPRIRVTRPDDAYAFYEETVEAGHEGIMAKAPEGTYQAGARGRSWLKIKPSHTLDLVVLAAEWGSGRRKGWLSNLHLGALDPDDGGFVMLGKTFKGLTDELLTWQTEALQRLEVERNDWQVFVRPELVVEVAFNDVQVSPQYPGGVALRFARVKRYRPDKEPHQADTIHAVRALLPT